MEQMDTNVGTQIVEEATSVSLIQPILNGVTVATPPHVHNIGDEQGPVNGFGSRA